MKTLKLVAAIAALTGSVGASAGTIDLFTAPAAGSQVQVVGSANVGTTDFIENSDAGDPGSILGEYRDMSVTLLSATPGNAFDGTRMNVSGGKLSFSADAGTTGQGSIQWDGNDNLATLNTTGLGGVNFLALGDAFTFDVISSDHPFDFSIGLYDMAGNSVVYDLQATTGSHTSTIAFNFFTNAFADFCGGPLPSGVNSVACSGTGPLDMMNIGAMEVILGTNGGTTELDLRIGAIRTPVPEPSSIALIGLGLLASGFAGTRKSKKA